LSVRRSFTLGSILLFRSATSEPKPETKQQENNATPYYQGKTPSWCDSMIPALHYLLILKKQSMTDIP
jgi:hypothetical protein